MGFNPIKETGIPVEQQIRNWSELNVKPYDKKSIHPYTRTRIILMNGIEIEGALFSHQFARNTDDLELKRKLALIRRIEQQQQKAVNWLIPADESALEVTIGYEQVAVDLTAFLARNEQDPYIKRAFDFGLLEDFDHLYRYANLLDLTQGKRAEEITGEYTEITVGRPTILEHRHPFDDVRKHYDKDTADISTQLHVLTLTAAEQQTMNFYMNVGNRSDNMVGRGLYLEIGQIEEQHVTHYESLLDPRASWFEKLLLHEYNECYMYYSCMQSEVDPQMLKFWKLHLEMEIEHLKMACDLMRKYEKREPADIFLKDLPELTIFQPNVDYVREILSTQTSLTANETEFVPVGQLPKNHRYFQYQNTVNNQGVPSQQIIEQHIDAKGKEYRQELYGPHPVEEYREKKKA